MSAGQDGPALQSPAKGLPADARRALRAAALRVAGAHAARTEAIAAAHRAGGSIPDIARGVGMDAFDVRDILVKAGELEALKPKEASARRL